MPIYFRPNGILNISSDPSDLPGDISEDGRSETSGAMQRCKNLRLDQGGIAETRDGASKLNTVAIDTRIWRIIEQEGTRYVFASDSIYEDETSIDSGFTDSEWSAIIYNAYNSSNQSIFALNGTDRKRIQDSTVYEWGTAAPDTEPEISVGADTGLTGDYNAKYTYARKEGATVVYESNPSDAASDPVTLADGSLLIFFESPSDDQITHIRIYRTLSSGDIYYHDQDVEIINYSYFYDWEASDGYISGTGYDMSQDVDEEGVGTINTDQSYNIDTNTSDSGLGSEPPDDHDRPPLGTQVVGPNFNGTCFIVKDNLLYYCKPKQPEYWPSTYYIEVSPPNFNGQSAVFWNGQLYYITKNEIYQIQGTGHQTIFPYPMNAITGTQSKNGVFAVAGMGIFHVGSDGVYLWNGVDKKITQTNFDPIFRGETVNGIPGVGDLSTSWIIQFKSKIYFGYASSDDDYPTNILVFDTTTMRPTYYSYGMEIRTVAIDSTNNRLLGGDNDGYMWILEDETMTMDDSLAISWEVQTKDFTLSTRRHFPRYCKYDVDASDSTSAEGSVVLDGNTIQTHTLSGDRNTKKRLITTNNGKRCSVNISGSGPVKIYAIEAE